MILGQKGVIIQHFQYYNKKLSFSFKKLQFSKMCDFFSTKSHDSTTKVQKHF